MAPGTRRANRGGYTEHDDFEGLPVRQWRQDWVNIAPPQPQEHIQQNDIWAIELIHGMPKDSALLAPHSQELLRAARSGRLYKRPAPAEEEEADTDAAQVAEKTEKKEEESAVHGFSIKLWKQVPRNIEGSALSHLAKRRKGTVTIASKSVEEKTAAPTVTRATVRRTDAAGNPYTEEVTLADGQQVVGEIISTRVEVASTATFDGFIATAPPQRRRPPPPKRKSKAGPGRGKKKIKNPLLGEGLAAAGATQTVVGVGSAKAHGSSGNGTSHEGMGTPNPESEMPDGDDDDDDEDGDDSDEGDDDDQEEGDQQGDDADDAKIQDEEMTDTVDERRPPTPSKLVVDAADSMATQIDAVPPNPLALAPSVAHLATNSPKNEGSPLKNVMLQSQSPTESQAPPIIPTNAAEVAPIPAAAPATVLAKLPAIEIVIGEVTETEPKREFPVAEPPSTVAGEEGRTRADADVIMAETVESRKHGEAPGQESQSEALYKDTSPEKKAHLSLDEPSRVEALLPPPPEQVGNISSPRAYDGPDRGLDYGDRTKDSQARNSGMIRERLPLNTYDSLMIEDTIKPEDSASFRFPPTESGAPSEVGTASAEEAKYSTMAEAGLMVEAPRDLSPPRPAAADSLGDNAMVAESDELRLSREEARRDSLVAPAPALGDSPPALEPKHSPAGTREDLKAEPTEPGPSEAARNEVSSALDGAVQDFPRVDAAPQPMDEVATEVPKIGEAVKTERIPEAQDVQESAKTKTHEHSSDTELEVQRDGSCHEGKEEAQDERRDAPMEESQPAPTPRPDCKAPLMNEAAAAPALPPILPAILPSNLPPAAEVASESHAADGAGEDTKDASASA